MVTLEKFLFGNSDGFLDEETEEIMNDILQEIEIYSDYIDESEDL